jgi:hypothetical protein
MKPPSQKTRQGGSQGGGDRDAAEAMAIAALSFLASDPEKLGVFLALSGIGPESIREAAGEPLFLAGVLDHVASNERLLLDFAEHHGVDPFAVTRARAALAGPQQDAP